MSSVFTHTHKKKNDVKKKKHMNSWSVVQDRTSFTHTLVKSERE